MWFGLSSSVFSTFTRLPYTLSRSLLLHLAISRIGHVSFRDDDDDDYAKVEFSVRHPFDPSVTLSIHPSQQI